MKHVGGQRHVGDACHTERLAVVETFQLRQFIQVFQDQVADLVNNAPARGRAHAAPGAVFQRLARSLHRRVDIGRVAFCHPRQQHFGGGVLYVEDLARLGLNPFAVDQHGARLGQPVAQGRWHTINGGGESHGRLPVFCFGRELGAVSRAENPTVRASLTDLFRGRHGPGEEFFANCCGAVKVPAFSTDAPALKPLSRGLVNHLLAAAVR